MKTRIFPLFLVLLIISNAFGQDKTTLKQLKGFDDFVNGQLKIWSVPGVAVAIVKDGEVVLSKGYGVRDITTGQPVTQDTQFAIGSSSKAFTALGVLMLADEGEIEMDEPLQNYLKDFRLHDDYVAANLTPRDLLCHRVGLPRHDFAWYGSSRTREEIYEALEHLEPNQGFREVFQYQNLMFMTAGILIERVSGKTWEEYTREKILQPLGMNTSNFSVTEIQKASDFAQPHLEEDGKVVKIPFRNIDEIGPAGSINSSVNEMSNWLKLQLNKGIIAGDTIISTSLIDQSHTPYTVISAPLRWDEYHYPLYGLGWFISAYQGHLMVVHGGNIDGFSANVGLLPKDGIGVVVLTNLNGNPLPGIIRNNIFDRLLGLDQVDWSGRAMEDREKAEASADEQEDTDKVEGTSPSHKLEDYAGLFEHPGYGKMEIKMIDSLQWQFNGFDLPLAHYHYDVFQADDNILGKQKLSFSYNARGEIDAVSIGFQPGMDDIVFKRTFEEIELESGAIDEFLGEYVVAGTNIKIWKKSDGLLMMTVPGQPDYTMIAIGKDKFDIKELDGFQAGFEREENGKITTLVLYQPNGTFKAQKK